MSLFSGVSTMSYFSGKSTLFERAIASVFAAIERRFGSVSVSPELSSELATLLVIANRLKKSGVIRSFGRRTATLPDEPHLFAWNAPYADDDAAAGASATLDSLALVSTLAEALERYLWRFDTRPLADSFFSSEQDMHAAGLHFVPISSFAGFSHEQRQRENALQLDADTRLRWCKAKDVLSGRSVYVPTQTLTAVHEHNVQKEPLVRPIITTGLATGVTRTKAVTAGMLEIIERDAFMVMWLNQLTYPRIDLEQLAKTHVELRTLLERAARYSLSFSAIRMMTDAPAHAVLGVVEDAGPRPQANVIVGMGCRQSLADAAAHALLEALRIRVNARTHYNQIDPASIIPKKIRHTERVPYWLHAERWRRLRFLTDGPISSVFSSDWEQDSADAYFERLKKWCRERNYSCVSYALGKSNRNPTSWFVESVVIPELQPMHIVERYQCLGGTRLTEIPLMFGYTPRAEPFSEEPHPFA